MNLIMYAVTLLAVAMLLPMSYMAQDAPTVPYSIPSALQQDLLYGLPSAFGVTPECSLAGCPSPPARAPNSPQLNAVVDGTTVTLTWNIPDDGGATIKKYLLHGLTSSSGPYWIKISDIPADVRHATFVCNESLSCSSTMSTGTGDIIIVQITGLATNQSHGFQVFAQNYVGASPSNNVWITTTPPAAPDPPRNLAANIGDKKVTLMWDAPIRTGGSPITEYVISARIGTVNPFHEVKKVSSSETSVTLDTINGMPYQFVVYAKNNVSTSGASNIAKAVSISLPGAPTNLTATPNSNNFVLSWTAPISSAAAPVDKYVINVKINTSGRDVDSSEEHFVPADTTTFTLTRLTHSNYEIAVHAVNDIGIGPPVTHTYTSNSGPE